MKRILFLGACEKSDLLLYVSKVLAKSDYKVLLVDATAGQLYQDWVPRIDQEYKVMEYEGFDVASGFLSYDSLQTYCKSQQEDLSGYSCIILDTDRVEAVANWSDSDLYVLVTTLEKRTINRNVELLKPLFAGPDSSTVRMFKVVLQHVECMIDETYIESVVEQPRILWTEPSYLLFFNELDYSIKVENQYNQRLQMKPLSKDYKNTIVELACLVSGLPESVLKKALKEAEKGK